jgi:hypothetical protein
VKKTRTKKSTQRSTSRSRSRGPVKRAKSSRPALRPPEIMVEPIEPVPEPSLPVEEGASMPEIIAAEPERDFATRAIQPELERPLPVARRAIFFDVENTSRSEHIARVIDHLALDRMGRRTDFIAVGNWKVIGHDTARLLARHGAQLVHSAPSVGVRDWSDLRIAVAAGAWLAGARPGDVMEIITNDRAFDAVGDVAAGLGIAFRRLSYQGLVGASVPAPSEEPVRESGTDSRGRRRRRGRRYSWRESGAAVAASPPPPREVSAPVHPASPVVAELPRTEVGSNGAEPLSAEPHTAPHDEIIAVVRELIHRAPNRGVTIDTLANALKSRGFSRPPGSPRLITRLRRIKEITVSRSGMITLVAPAGPVKEPEAVPPLETPPAVTDGVVAPTVAPDGASDIDEEPGDSIGNIAPSAEAPAPPPRYRSHRGGRRRFPHSQRASV